MRYWWCLIIGLGSLALAQNSCISTTMDKPFWQSIKTSGFAVPQGRSADELAQALLGCLASPDPELRDSFGYEILTRWFRGGQVSNPALKAIAKTLTDNLKMGIGESGTDSIFRRSFSALMLSEVIRRDTQAPFLEPAEFRAILEAALAYLPAERDLRGYDGKLGYIHGVAHGADLLWRLAISPKTDKADLERILQATRSKIAPEGEHAYIHNESDRLARVVVFAMNRGILDSAWLKDWVKQTALPGSLGKWDNAFSTTAGLARLHNTKQFLRALENFISIGTRPKGADELLPSVTEAIETVTLF